MSYPNNFDAASGVPSSYMSAEDIVMTQPAASAIHILGREAFEAALQYLESRDPTNLNFASNDPTLASSTYNDLEFDNFREITGVNNAETQVESPSDDFNTFNGLLSGDAIPPDDLPQGEVHGNDPGITDETVAENTAADDVPAHRGGLNGSLIEARPQVPAQRRPRGSRRHRSSSHSGGVVFGISARGTLVSRGFPAGTPVRLRRRGEGNTNGAGNQAGAGSQLQTGPNQLASRTIDFVTPNDVDSRGARRSRVTNNPRRARGSRSAANSPYTRNARTAGESRTGRISRPTPISRIAEDSPSTRNARTAAESRTVRTPRPAPIPCTAADSRPATNSHQFANGQHTLNIGAQSFNSSYFTDSGMADDFADMRAGRVHSNLFNNHTGAPSTVEDLDIEEDLAEVMGTGAPVYVTAEEALEPAAGDEVTMSDAPDTANSDYNIHYVLDVPGPSDTLKAIGKATETQSALKTEILNAMKTGKHEDGVDLEAVKNLYVNAGDTAAKAQVIKDYWQGKRDYYTDLFNTTRLGLATQGVANNRRRHEKRDAGGILNPDKLNDATPERRVWIKKKAKEDMNLRKLLGYSDGMTSNFAAGIESMNKTRDLIRKLVEALFKVRGERVQSSMGLETNWVVGAKERWYMENAGAIIAAGTKALQEVANCIAKMPPRKKDGTVFTGALTDFDGDHSGDTTEEELEKVYCTDDDEGESE